MRSKYEYEMSDLDFLDIYDAEGDFIKSSGLTIIYTKERCNDGIGSFEFWGSKYYDSGIDYWEVEIVGWNKDAFNDAENKVIEEYINCNEELIIEKIIESL
jgi:uncharacterized protein RhaS with RHS repeats